MLHDILVASKESLMPTIRCPNCGHSNVSLRNVCDRCHAALKPPQVDHVAPRPTADTQGGRTVLDDIAEFIYFSGVNAGDLRIDIPGFLADLQKMRPELPDLTIPERFLGPKQPRIEPPTPALDTVDLPELDFSIVLSYLANLKMPQLDMKPALDILAALRLPQIDLPALGELLPHIDLTAVNLPALAELLPHIDLTAVDLPALGNLLSNIDLSVVDPAVLAELLSNIDLSAVDLSAFADVLAGVDWSVLGELLSEIDASVLFDLLEGVDLG